MKIINKSKITNLLNFNLKLIVLSSLLFSRLSLYEIFLYQNNSDTSSINIAQADASDTWYDTSYLYRKEINITGSASDLTNYQVKKTIDYVAGKMNPDFSDLRFVSADGLTVYNYYIESKTDSVTANVWIKLSSIPTAGTYIYMYYGNSGASTASSGNDTFSVFDDFNNSAIDPEWTVVNPNGSQTISEDSSSVSLRTAATVADLAISTGNQNAPRIVQGITGNFVAEAKITTINAYYDLTGILLWKDSQNFYVFGKGMRNGSERIWRRKNVGDSLSEAEGSGTYTFDTLYLKMVRNGNLLTCYYSDDNNPGVWSQSFSETFTVTDPVSIGFVRFDATSRTYNGTADWFFTARYASPEPVVSLGIEEAIATSYNLTAPSPSSGIIDTPSEIFTITPNGIFNGTITITPSGGGLSTPITKTFTNSSTSQTFTITPTVAGTVTLTLTNSGGFTNPSPATYSSISISASPSSIIQGSTGNTIDIIGINTSWTDGTPGAPTFTLSGGTGASITSQTVTNSTHATLTINAGSIAGDLALGDPSTGATTIVSVVPSTSNLITSFNLSTPAATGTINDTDHTVSLTVPYGTNVTSLSPTITVSTGATISPTSGTSHNFTSPATYTVTAQDGTTTQNYIVTVIVSPSTAGGFIAPTQPIIPIQDNRIDISNLPQDIIQITISRTPDFKDVSWEVFSNEEIKQLDNCPDKLYIKFRDKSGAVSDVIVYVPKANNDTNISNLQDGDIVKTINNPDVYIIKIKNNKQFKRLVLSPSVFQSYGHLKWGNVKIISQEELNRYVTSDLVKETTDTIIYELFPNGDTGERRAFDNSRPYDADSIYEINKVDRDSYELVR